MVSCFQSGLQRFLAPSEWPAALSLSLSLRPRLVRVLSDVLNETVYLAEQATVGADATN